MKIGNLLPLFFMVFAQAGCVGPTYAPLKPEDSLTHVVIVVEVESRETADGTERFGVTAINGHPVLGYQERRAEKNVEGKVARFYVLLPAGQYDVTFSYGKFHTVLASSRAWTAEVTKRIELKNGIIRCCGTVSGQFATLWLEDAAGHRLTNPEEALVKERPKPTSFPIFIPVSR